MTRDALADRLVNYADAATAFSAVNSLAFLVALTETEIRCSLAHLQGLVLGGQLSFSLVIGLTVFILRRLEIKVRAAADPLSPDVERFLRGFFIARIVIVGLFAVFTLGFAAMALTDSTCSPV